MSETHKSFINLIDDSQEKTATSVQHFSLKLNQIERRPEVVLKIIENYSTDIHLSQVIVFCQTKQECDSLGESNEMRSISSDILHGNLSQRKREQVLAVKNYYLNQNSVYI